MKRLIFTMAIAACCMTMQAQTNKKCGRTDFGGSFPHTGWEETIWQQCNESLPGEIRIMPARCSDNNHQEGAKASVEFTLDRDNSTLWHSAYYPEHKKVTPESPAELIYEFENVERIDRMVYVPRQDGSPNGYVTEAEVLV